MVQLAPQSVFHALPSKPKRKLLMLLDGLVECEREFIISTILLRRACVGLNNFDTMDEYTIDDAIEDLEVVDIIPTDEARDFLNVVVELPDEAQLAIAKELMRSL